MRRAKPSLSPLCCHQVCVRVRPKMCCFDSALGGRRSGPKTNGESNRGERSCGAAETTDRRCCASDSASLAAPASSASGEGGVFFLFLKSIFFKQRNSDKTHSTTYLIDDIKNHTSFFNKENICVVSNPLLQGLSETNKSEKKKSPCSSTIHLFYPKRHVLHLYAFTFPFDFIYFVLLLFYTLFILFQ